MYVSYYQRKKKICIYLIYKRYAYKCTYVIYEKNMKKLAKNK